MREHILGAFTLHLEESGKLAALAAGGRASFLSTVTNKVEMAPGLFFEPRGWDECFPTIEPFGTSPVMGELVWTPPRLELRPDAICQYWACPTFSAERRFTVQAPHRLGCAFAVTLHAVEPLSFVWASHSLFTLDGLCRVEFAGGPVLDDFVLDGSSSKSFVENRGAVRLVREDCELLLETDQPYWGLWNNRGGWPKGESAGSGVLGLEATNAQSDLPEEALLESGQTFSGTVSLEVVQ
jgi:hypothetical protein